MSRKPEICLVVDVETAGTLEQPLVYDLGLAVVVRRTGEILESHSLIIREVFFGMKEDMRSAYYADKLPQYFVGIKNGDFRVVRFWTAWRLVRDLMAQYGIERVYAYNTGFDRRALNNTMRALTTRRYARFFPKNTKFGCIWHMACQVIFTQKNYRKFANEHNLISPSGNMRTSAEACYAYINNRPDFSESHTGLADVGIEVEIMQHAIRQHKRMVDDINYNPWRIPNAARV